MSKQVVFNSADDVESVFYESFQFCDVQVMAAIWSMLDASCVHPGTDFIHGYQAVVRSWSHILSASGQANISFTVLHRDESAELAVHIVEEKITTVQQGTSRVIATNVYKKNQNGWQMIAHHGSLVQTEVASTSLQ